MGIVRYDRAAKRVWVFKARVHHGFIGLILFAVGGWLMYDDRHDAPWLTDSIKG